MHNDTSNTTSDNAYTDKATISLLIYCYSSENRKFEVWAGGHYRFSSALQMP